MTTSVDGQIMSSARVVAIPSRHGISTSITTTSGQSPIDQSSAASPSDASPIT